MLFMFSLFSFVFFVRDNSQAAFRHQFYCKILIDTKKQLQLKTYKIVQLQIEIISCSCTFIYRTLQLFVIPWGRLCCHLYKRCRTGAKT